jgi:GNAT superfamily N-acetyltransferase
MITYRRYIQSDIPTLIDKLERDHIARLGVEKTGFDRNKITDLLVGNLKNSLFFLTVAVKDGEVVGAFCASVYTFIFSHEAIAVDHLFYIDKAHRSITVATELVAAYTEWAKARKVKRAELRNVTGENIETFSKMAQKFGFKLIGTYHAMEF